MPPVCVHWNMLSENVFNKKSLGSVGVSPQKAPESRQCPETDGVAQWVQYDGNCYAFDMTFYNYSVYSLAEAKTICEKLGKFYLKGVSCDI